MPRFSTSSVSVCVRVVLNLKAEVKNQNQRHRMTITVDANCQFECVVFLLYFFSLQMLGMLSHCNPCVGQKQSDANLFPRTASCTARTLQGLSLLHFN